MHTAHLPTVRVLVATPPDVGKWRWILKVNKLEQVTRDGQQMSLDGGQGQDWRGHVSCWEGVGLGVPVQ